ncbi:MAG: hypothetical protein KC613_06450, partial [Myxococcales bacterium]|nr:hypothetical protein [Myxococcales bacterium]
PADDRSGGDGFGGDGFGGDGFGGADPGFAPPPPPPADLPPPPGYHQLTLTGFARRDEALWTERFEDPAARPYAKLRHSLDLTLDYGFKRAVKVVLAGHLEHDLAYTLADG